MKPKPLINNQDLEKQLANKDIVIVDSRFDLANPAWGYETYLKGHIPGAIFMDLNKDLAGEVTPQTGRHPLPDPLVFTNLLGAAGVDQASKVVVYDANGGAFAARLWWMLRMLGHEDVAILDGGFPKWKKEGKPIKTGVEKLPKTVYPFTPFNTEMFATRTEVESALSDSDRLLIDARTPERFRGEVEPIDPIAGHIPGALNRFHGLNLNQDGTLKPPEQLSAEFTALLSGHNPQSTIMYCGSGVTSIHHLLAMELAGLPLGKVYIGSWSEWIRDPKNPRIP